MNQGKVKKSASGSFIEAINHIGGQPQATSIVLKSKKEPTRANFLSRLADGKAAKPGSFINKTMNGPEVNPTPKVTHPLGDQANKNQLIKIKIVDANGDVTETFVAKKKIILQ